MDENKFKVELIKQITSDYYETSLDSVDYANAIIDCICTIVTFENKEENTKKILNE